jgi:pyroglutamyl-peptidase
MTVVVQGFGPFGDRPENPSRQLVRALAERRPGLVCEVIDTSVRVASAAVPELLERHRPDTWIGVGLAAGRAALAVEAVAVNLADWSTETADVDGVSAVRRPIAAAGPAAYVTTLPVAEILAAWRVAEIPGYLSLSAGSYLCNYSFYLASHTAAERGLGCRVGFIHVPLTPELVTDPGREPSMALADQLTGLEAVLDACERAPVGAGLHASVGSAEDGSGALH